MPRYTPITQVMPLASMVSGAVVTSALCDQIDDNLAALYEGVWFRARRSTTQTLPNSVVDKFILDTIVMSDTATDSGYVSLSAGSVQTILPGHWMVGGHYSIGSAGIFLSALLDATDMTAFVAETVNDTTSGKTDVCCGPQIVNVTSTPNLFSLWAYTTSTPVADADQKSAVLWGVYMGDV